jgi:2-iminobutanoate/2-iminopropanoate deaminase
MKEIKTKDAPEVVGPYSQAVVAGSLVFCSGQLGLDPQTGALIRGGASKETEQALKNLKAVLAAEKVDVSAVGMVNVYLTRMSDFAAVNAVYENFFTTTPQPARVTVGVAELPKGALVEISCIACK